MKSPNLIRSSAIVMGGYLASKLVGVVREPLIARAFGTGDQLDAYYAAFNIPDLLFTLIAGGALVTAFIPLYAETVTARGQAAGWRMASSVINLVLLSMAAIALTAALFAPQLVSCCVAPGFGPSQQALTVNLMRLIFTSTLLFGLAGVLMGVLNAQQHFLTPAFAPVLYNLGIVGGALFLAPRYGIYGVAYGVIIGSALYLLIHIPPLLRQGFRYQPGLMLSDPLTHQMLRLMAPRILALGVIKVNTLVGTNLASRLEAGSVSALNIAYILMQIPETVIATAIATAVFPTLSLYAAAGQRDALRSTIRSALRAILLLSVPAMVGLLLLGRPIVSVLYQGGRFDERSMQLVLWALNFYAVGLLGQSFLEVVARVFYAQKDTLTPLLVAVAAMTINATLAWALIGSLAHGGIALANSIAVTCEMGVLLFLASRRLPGVQLRQLMGAALPALAAGSLMAILLWLFDRYVDSPLVLLTGGALAAVCYFAVLWLAGVSEARGATQAMRRRPSPTSGSAPEQAASSPDPATSAEHPV